MAYPAPIRMTWMVVVELPDGNAIFGTSAVDVIDRWARLMSWGGDHFDRPRLMRAIHDRLATFWEAPPDVAPDTLDYDAWLDSLARTGIVTIIWKDGR